MARKKSTAQLNREIDEALADPKTAKGLVGSYVAATGYAFGKRPKAPKAVKRNSQIVRGGMGNFGDPPGYPTHSFHVEVDLRRRPENRGTLSLNYALKETFIDPATKQEARDLIEKWETHRPAITSAKVQEWIQQVLKHHGENAGIEQVQKFYPEFGLDRLSADERVAIDALLAGNGKRSAEVEALVPDADRRKYIKTLADQLKSLRPR